MSNEQEQWATQIREFQTFFGWHSVPNDDEPSGIDLQKTNGLR